MSVCASLCVSPQFQVVEGVHSKLPPLRIHTHATVTQEVAAMAHAMTQFHRTVLAASSRRGSRTSFATTGMPKAPTIVVA